MLSTVAPYSAPEDRPLIESFIAFTSGWGHTEVAGVNKSNFHDSTRLKYLKVPLIKTTKCEIITQVTSMEICAGYIEGGKDYCVGDTGGPLIIPGLNQSAIIYGILSNSPYGCALKNQYGIYARVTKSLNWIRSMMKNK